MKPIIVTTYNHRIDPRVPAYQSMVFEKLRGTIPFMPFKYPYEEDEMYHGDILNRVVHRVFYEMGGDALFIIDVDCIPLSSNAIKTVFDLVEAGHLVGNIQRSNHIQNNQHVFVAPSCIAFSEETFMKLMCPSFTYNHIGDTAEQFTYNAEKENVPVTYFMPSDVESPYNEEGEYWDLKDGMPKYGIGTTFSYNNEPMTYHLFSSRYNSHTKFFLDKCHSILTK